MRKEKKSSYHHGSLREDLLRVGSEHLRRVGESGLSLREVARELGVSPAAPYRHFADKEVFLDELAIEGWRELSGRLSDLPTLGQQLRAYRDFVLEEPALMRVMFGRSPEGDRGTMLYEASNEAFLGLMRVIDSLLPKGLSVKGHYKAALVAWSLVHGLAMLSQDKGMGPFIENVGLTDAEIEEFLRMGLAFWRPA